MKLKCNDCNSLLIRIDNFAEPCDNCKSDNIEVFGSSRIIVRIRRFFFNFTIAGRYIKNLRNLSKIRYNKVRGHVQIKFSKYGQTFEVSENGIPCANCDKTMFKGWSQLNGKLYCSKCSMRYMAAPNVKGVAHGTKQDYQHESRREIAKRFASKME